jgi:hypothetical protein
MKDYVLLCDDVREEKSNKLILVGVYSSGLLVFPRLPASIQKLMIVVGLRFTRPLDQQIRMRVVHVLSGQEFLSASTRLTPNVAGRVALPLPWVNPAFEQPGEYAVQLDLGAEGGGVVGEVFHVGEQSRIAVPSGIVH